MISKACLLTFRSLVLVGVGSLLILLASQDAIGAGTYNPSGSLCLDDITTPAECDGDTSPGAVTDVYSTFNVDEGDYQFYGNVTFIPPAVVNGINLNTPTGAVVGYLGSIARLGLLNSPCNKTVDVKFTMLNGSTNNSPGNEIAPRPPGSNNVQTPLAEDANGNGLPDGVDKYPSYLNNLFDYDLKEGADGEYRTGDDLNGPEPALTPIMRTIGITKVPGPQDWIVLQFLIFEPGSKLKNFPSFPASLGYPSVTVLQDPSAPPYQSAINDYCSPLRATIVWYGVSRDNPCTGVVSDPSGLCPARPVVEPTDAPALDPQGCDGDADESNCDIRKNPPAGSYQYILHTESRRDADGDGIENFLDTCPFDATPNWNPRDDDPTWDPDGDGLVGKADGSGKLIPGTGCDPKPQEQSPGSDQTCPEGLTGPDYEQDCFADRQDNCPLIINDQVDGDKDEIGDECDPHPSNPDTEGAEVLRDLKWCLTLPGSPQAADGECPEGPGVNGGTPTPTPPPTQVVDSDGDTVPDSLDQCPDTEAGATVDANGCSAEQLEELEDIARDKLLDNLVAGEVGLVAVLDTVAASGSTKILAACADDNANAIPGAEITFKIDSQPGSDANLEDQPEVTKTADAEGVAEATLNGGTTPGTIVVSGSAEGCETKTIEITVAGETNGSGGNSSFDGSDGDGPAGGPDDGVGSLAPAVSSIPAWGAIASGLGGAGLLASLGALVSRILRRRE